MYSNKQKHNHSFMDCDVDDTLVVVSYYPSLEKPKTHKRSRIRRLVDSDHMEKNKNESTHKYKCISIVISLIILTIAILHTPCNRQLFGQNSSIKELYKNYNYQYFTTVHGKSNYCDQKQLNTTSIFARIRQSDILHQEQALQQIELSLINENALNAVALIGPPGVGKSLFVRSLYQNFPWQENVHTYAWNTFVKDEAEKFHLIRLLIENLSECGQNLLVIDNLQPCDHSAVDIINQMLIDSINRQHKRVVIFYVFNLNTMLNPDAYNKQKDLLQSLTNCSVINFKPFTKEELKDCIKREAKIENITLAKSDFDEIVDTIEPLKSGCKNVNAKLIMYGTIKTKNNVY